MSRKIKSCSFRSFRKLPALACLCGVLAGCAGGGGHTRTVRIGVALYSQDDTFISAVVQEIEQLARSRENSSDLKINLSIADGRSNQTIQLEQVDRLLDSGCDVLCVNIVDRTAAAVLIDKVSAADVPVIFFNRQPVQEDIRRWEQVYYVGPKGEQSGIYQGEILLEEWNGNRASADRNADGVLQYVMLEGEPGHQDALLRSEYATKPLTDAGVPLEKLASDTANWSRAQAAARMKIEVIFANNDDMALGAIDAMKEAGVDPLPLVVGVDGTEPALKALEEGELLGTVRNAPDMPDVLLELSLALADGGPVPESIQVEDGHYIWLPYYKLTSDTLP